MPGIDLALLRRQVSWTQGLELVGFTARHRSGVQVRGPCPLHGSSARRSRFFSAHLERHLGYCFRCRVGGNALDLYLAVTKLPRYEGALELCQRLHLPVPWQSPARSRSPP